MSKREAAIYGTIEEISTAEEFNSSYIDRLLRMTLLAPDSVEAILDGRQLGEMTLARLMKPLPVVWHEQRLRFL